MFGLVEFVPCLTNASFAGLSSFDFLVLRYFKLHTWLCTPTCRKVSKIFNFNDFDTKPAVVSTDDLHVFRLIYGISPAGEL